MDQPDAEPALGAPGSVAAQRDGDTTEDLSEARSTPALTPQVVAVVVTHDPGPWFEEALSSLVDQDYPNLSILVIDAGSAVDPTPRIAAVASRAFVRRLDDNPGYGAAVNVAMRMVEGASFYLLCHDDVALARGATRLLVEEAYRSNAGIVGPKLVHWDQPGALLQVGMGADRFAAPAALCERGELDQEQHDAVRDVFAVPGGCFLVRADLFVALGGFDDVITFHGDDTDLSWRAHLAGARVLVAPSATVRHVEALGDRRPDDRRRLQARHRLRMVLTNYGWFYLIGVGLQQLVLSAVEILVALVTGRFRQAGEVFNAYVWNLRRTGSILAKRRANARRRQLTDLEIRRMQVRGSARLTAFIRGQLGTGEAGGGSLADAGRQWLFSVRAGIARENLLLGLAVAAVVAFGSRELIFRSLPAVGELVVLPDRAMDLMRSYGSDWRSTGLGALGAAPTGLGLFGLAGLALFGGTGLLRLLLVLGTLPVGLWGAWRLGSFAPHSRAKAAALIAYAANPLPYNALAVGSWRGLVMYAAAPWMVRRLAVIAQLAPFGGGTERVGRGADRAELVDGVDAEGHRASRAEQGRLLAGLALGTAVAMVFYPAAVLLLGLMALALVVGSALVGSGAGSLRLLVAAGVAGAVALVLHGAWLLDAIGTSDPDLTFAGRSGGAEDHALRALLHFDTGVANRSLLTWGLLIAGLLGLAIGRSWRLRWAVRGWALFGLPLGLVAVVQAGWLDVRLPPAEVLLAPCAVGVSLAVAAGMAAFDRDLPVYRFGWRQVASVGAAAGLIVASVPLLAGAFDGRWRMPRTGYDRTFGFMADEAVANGPFRVLWLGPADALPVGGWDLGDGVAYATSIGFPQAEGLWTGPEDDAARLVPQALDRARRGDSSRLGRTFGSMGIRYVVVVSQLAPAPYKGRAAPLPSWLGSVLGEQLDLAQLDLNAAVSVYRNPAWLPLVANLPPDVQRVEDLPASTDGAPTPAPALQSVDAKAQQFEGDVAGGTVLHLAQARHPQWRLEVDGTTVVGDAGFGWANRYTVAQPGAAELRFATSTGHLVLMIGQLVAWLLVAFLAVRRRRPAGKRTEEAPAAVEPAPAMAPSAVEVTV